MRKEVERLLSIANIRINGTRAWDVQVHNPLFFHRVLSHGSLGLGEAYMDGWWDCDDLAEFFHRVLKTDLDKKVLNWRTVLSVLRAKLISQQSKRRAFVIGKKHYDLGNNLYQSMLDKRLTYTGGYWKSAKTLDLAQEAKLDLVCRKIGLKKGQRVLDIGCGWGSFAKFAAEKYGAKVVGITVSKEQIILGKKLCKGLPIEFRLQDYRDVNEPFDHVVSLGMFEHVGYKNYKKYVEVVHRCLKPKGFFLLHTIGCNKSVKSSDRWITKYIFPNSMLPSIKQIGEAIEGLFVMEDWHNFSADYEKTLLCWHKNFISAWPKISHKYDERFFRMWTYYLLSCAGLFRARKAQLWQIVLSKEGVKGVYECVR